jgi:hypothetical protein
MSRITDPNGNFVDFTEANPGENEPYGFDFRNDVYGGETVTACVFELSVDPESTGDDPSPESRLMGDPAILEDTKCSQFLSGLLPGVDYILTCYADTSRGATKVLYAHIPALPIK